MVVLFGLYSVITIAYRYNKINVFFLIIQISYHGFRVATFNDCEAASEELQKQILEAREDLRMKGFSFEEISDKKRD